MTCPDGYEVAVQNTECQMNDEWLPRPLACSQICGETKIDVQETPLDAPWVAEIRQGRASKSQFGIILNAKVVVSVLPNESQDQACKSTVKIEATGSKRWSIGQIRYYEDSRLVMYGLNEPIPFTKHTLTPVCLPLEGQSKQLDCKPISLRKVGLGLTARSNDSTPYVLHQIINYHAIPCKNSIQIADYLKWIKETSKEFLNGVNDWGFCNIKKESDFKVVKEDSKVVKEDSKVEEEDSKVEEDNKFSVIQIRSQSYSYRSLAGLEETDARDDSDQKIHKDIPWHVGVYHGGPTDYMHWCGGTLINENTVVSAMQRFWNSTTNQPHDLAAFILALGKNHPSFDIFNGETQYFEVEKIAWPRNFHHFWDEFYQHDIVVVTLRGSIHQTDRVAPIPLPSAVDVSPPINLTAELTGTESNGWATFQMQIYPKECKQMLEPYLHFPEDLFFANTSRHDDEGQLQLGNGLVLNHPVNGYYFAGVTIINMRSGSEFAFTDVSMHLNLTNGTSDALIDDNHSLKNTSEWECVVPMESGTIEMLDEYAKRRELELNDRVPHLSPITQKCDSLDIERNNLCVHGKFQREFIRCQN